MGSESSSLVDNGLISDSAIGSVADFVGEGFVGRHVDRSLVMGCEGV